MVSGAHRISGRNLFPLPTQEQNQSEGAGDLGLPLAPGLRAEEKLRSLLVGPSLPVVMVSVTTLACSLPSQGPAVLTFPPQCPFGPVISGARSPPRCSLRGSQPNSLGISCHCGQEPRRCLLPGQPQYSGSLPHPQVGSREVREVGKGTQIPSVAELGTAPKTPDIWAMVSPWVDTQEGCLPSR